MGGGISLCDSSFEQVLANSAGNHPQWLHSMIPTIICLQLDQNNGDLYILADIISRGSYTTIYEATRKV